MRRYGSDGAPLALAQKVSDRQSGIAEVPLDPGALVPLYAAAAVELRYAAMPPDISIDASGATIVAWTAGFKLTPYLVLGAGYHPIGLGVQQVYAQRFDASGAAAGTRATIENSFDSRSEEHTSELQSLMRNSYPV